MTHVLFITICRLGLSFVRLTSPENVVLLMTNLVSASCCCFNEQSILEAKLLLGPLGVNKQ